MLISSSTFLFWYSTRVILHDPQLRKILVYLKLGLYGSYYAYYGYYSNEPACNVKCGAKYKQRVCTHIYYKTEDGLFSYFGGL